MFIIVTFPFWLLMSCLRLLNRCLLYFYPNLQIRITLRFLSKATYTFVTISNLFSYSPIIILLVVMMEKTIKINDVGPGEKVWTLGQTFALLDVITSSKGGRDSAGLCIKP